MAPTKPNDPDDGGLGQDPSAVTARTELATDNAAGSSVADADATNAHGPGFESVALSREGSANKEYATTDVAALGAKSQFAEPQIGPGLDSVPGYRVLREIARGGMGRVVAAVDLSLDRDVALKTLLPGASADRFVRESKITARLPHPGIPPVHALGTLADGSPFLAMKLIAGHTLADELKTADRPRLLQVFTQVCQAVGFAHSRGIIHRDLKPANVMVGAFGEVQVMDWGLAKDLDQPGQAGGVPVASAVRRFRCRRGSQPHHRPHPIRRIDRRADRGRDGHGHAGVHGARAGPRRGDRRPRRRVRAGQRAVRHPDGTAGVYRQAPLWK